MYVSGFDMSMYTNVTTVPYIGVKLVGVKYYHGVQERLCFTALRLKMYKIDIILSKFAK